MGGVATAGSDTTSRAMTALAEAAMEAGRAAGLDVTGIAPAAPFDETRRHLEERKRSGLSGGMQFTYRNPARSTDPGRLVAGARALLVGARSYVRTPAPGDDAAGPRGTVARYSWVDHYRPLRDGLEAAAAVLRTAGWQARATADDNTLVDREAAVRAGLGWYGKNSMVLLHGRGSEFVLGSVVTDAPLPPTTGPTGGAAASAGGCGPCTRCLPACPTGALVEPGVLDARRCLAWLVQAEGVFPREHRVALGDRLYGCDACQDACPPNRLEVRRRPLPPAEPGAEPTVELLALLEEPDDDRLLERYGRWYVARRQARHLRRNALVVLANVASRAEAREPRLERVLADALRAPDPLVRGHAVWAARRLGRDDLVDRHLAADEPDPDVRAELGGVVPGR
jgi:epoxyqueuosine reductase